MVIIHAVLTVLSTLALLISLVTLPLSYSILFLYATSCLCSNVHWAFYSCFKLSQSGFSTNGFINVLLTIVLIACAIALAVYSPMPKSDKLGKDSVSDSLISSIATSEDTKKALGYASAIVAGICFSLCKDLSKSPSMTRENGELCSSAFRRIASIMISLFIGGFLLMSFSSSGKKTEKKGSSLENLLCELFWIGVFSLTAKAALSISFDTNGQFSGDKSSRNRSSSTSDTNPIHCKMMCLVGTLYCFFVDFSFFEY